jgi:hypothetical protein
MLRLSGLRVRPESAGFQEIQGCSGHRHDYDSGMLRAPSAHQLPLSAGGGAGVSGIASAAIDRTHRHESSTRATFQNLAIVPLYVNRSENLRQLRADSDKRNNCDKMQHSVCLSHATGKGEHR